MIEVLQEENEAVRVFLVGKRKNCRREEYPGEKDGPDLDELRGLAGTLGMVVAGELVVGDFVPGPVYLVGKGKAEEIAGAAKNLSCDCIIFDFEISPTHQRNWEKLAGIPVFDRQELILRIFESRAATREAVLQVQLAKLNYSLPRLAHSYGNLSRQRGGNYGSKGSGETKLEMDRRAVQNEIFKIKKELEKVRQNRATQRKKRDRVPLPLCTLIGYTNAGKSSLLNALTGSMVYEKDELFATLDPSTRRLKKESSYSLLFTDTVGFIENLPHTLVEAFRSTLEEALEGDLLVIVVDSSSKDMEKIKRSYETTCSVLKEIGADSRQRLIVLNKADLIDGLRRNELKAVFPNGIFTSTRTGEGLEELVRQAGIICGGARLKVLIPYGEGALISLVYRTGHILSEEKRDNGILFDAFFPGSSGRELLPFVMENRDFD